jgi:hypothetical protein
VEKIKKNQKLALEVLERVGPHIKSGVRKGLNKAIMGDENLLTSDDAAAWDLYRNNWRANGRNGSDDTMPQLRLMMTVASGFCGDHFGVIADDNEHHIQALTNFIQEYMDNLKNRLDLNFNALFHHKENADITSALSPFRSIASLTHKKIFTSNLSELQK